MAKCNVNTVIQVATNEIGYLEKKSNSNLDSKTGNAGKNNYTKYNRDYKSWGAGGSINMQWCAAFVSWCFVKAYGLEAAKKLLCGGLHHYTPTGASRFKKKNQYIKRGSGKPKVGDVVFFYSKAKGRIGHVGIVYKVSSSTVYTIEGNTSGASTLVTNGGGVKKKSYKLTSTYIDGYGRPYYDNIEAGTGIVIDNNTSADIEAKLGDRLLEDGCAGADVKELQNALMKLGYKLPKYGDDGDFGKETEDAVKEFQKDYNLEVDGQYGSKSHAAMQTALKKIGADSNSKESKVEVTGSRVNVRTGNSILKKVLFVAKKGQTYKYVSTNGSWHEIITDKGNAWISAKYSKIV